MQRLSQFHLAVGNLIACGMVFVLLLTRSREEMVYEVTSPQVTNSTPSKTV